MLTAHQTDDAGASRGLAGLAIGVGLICLVLAVLILLSVGQWPGAPLELGGADVLALNARAASDLAAGDADKAAATARRSILQAPLNAVGLRVLALSLEPQGNANAAEPLLQQGGRLSLRDTTTHLRLMDDAFAAGRYTEGAFHADLLLRRQAIDPAVVFARLVGILSQPEGSQAVADRLALNPPWRTAFLVQSGGQASPDQFGAVLGRLAAAGATLDDQEVFTFFRRLIEDQDYADAQRFWRQFYGRGREPTAIYDEGFDGLPGPDPLNWQTLNPTGGHATLGAQDGGVAGELHLSDDGYSSSGALAQQIVLLKPGDYIVAAKARPADESSAGRFSLGVNCLRGSSLAAFPIGLDPAGWGFRSAKFTVPAEGCGAQVVVFGPVNGDRRETLDMDVDSVTITPIGVKPQTNAGGAPSNAP